MYDESLESYIICGKHIATGDNYKNLKLQFDNAYINYYRQDQEFVNSLDWEKRSTNNLYVLTAVDEIETKIKDNQDITDVEVKFLVGYYEIKNYGVLNEKRELPTASSEKEEELNYDIISDSHGHKYVVDNDVEPLQLFTKEKRIYDERTGRLSNSVIEETEITDVKTLYSELCDIYRHLKKCEGEIKPTTKEDIEGKVKTIENKIEQNQKLPGIEAYFLCAYYSYQKARFMEERSEDAKLREEEPSMLGSIFEESSSQQKSIMKKPGSSLDPQKSVVTFAGQITENTGNNLV